MHPPDPKPRRPYLQVLANPAPPGAMLGMQGDQFVLQGQEGAVHTMMQKARAVWLPIGLLLCMQERVLRVQAALTQA